jgi:hypothetical protein
MDRLFVLLVLTFALLPCGYSQKVVWGVYFDTQFDNREYNSSFNDSQTLFGAKLTPVVGLGWREGSALLVGATMIEEFGAQTFEKRPEMLLYYHYDSAERSVWAGRFSRKALIGEYGNAFFSDSIRFFDANIDGVLLQYRRDGGYAELAMDWDSRQSKTRREKFMIVSSAMQKWGAGYGGYHFLMHHHAMVTGGSGVVDNVWVMPFVGIDLGGRGFFDELLLEVGWLQSFQNDRSNEGKYIRPAGLHIRAQLEKGGVGVLHTLFRGDCMMPYYGRYGNELYQGDSFYATTNGEYHRLEIYWKPLQWRDADLKVSSVHHYDGRVWSWQQLASFTVHLGFR